MYRTNNVNYEITNGKIVSKNGIPYLPRWFCDDLVVFQADNTGITAIEYFNPTTKGNVKVMYADMWGGIRFYIVDNGINYYQNLTKTEIMPYGFKGKWKHNTYMFDYSMRVINNSIYICVSTDEDIGENLMFSMEMYDGMRLQTRQNGDFRYKSNIVRKWNGWRYEDGALIDNYEENGAYTHICIKTKSDNNYIERPVGVDKKRILEFKVNKGEKNSIVISLDSEQEKAKRRAIDTLTNADYYIEQQNHRYEKVIANSPKLVSPYKSLNDFVSLAPLYHEACKSTSVPGAVRAKTEHYWVWGWDGLTCSHAYTYWGDKDYIPKLLRMYMETADPQKGIAHMYARDMTHMETSITAAQGFYINVLYQYYINGGDISEYYDFAVKIFELIKSTLNDETGLCEGYSLFPDLRETIGETGRDISCFNNSGVYCALNVMFVLASYMNDKDTVRELTVIIEKMKNTFNTILFDEQLGWFYSSADADSLKPRKIYCANSIKWENKYCKDLVFQNKERILEFFEEHFICEQGIRPIPVWGDGFDADANQMHCWWPVTGELYARLINMLNRRDLIDKWIGWVSYWTDLLMCPEGIDCYANTPAPLIDCFNSLNGAFYCNSMRAWYEAVIHMVVGVDIDEYGLEFYPYDGEEMSLLGLNYADKKINIHMKGSGVSIERIEVNGENFYNKKISREILKEQNEIYVYRKKLF